MAKKIVSILPYNLEYCAICKTPNPEIHHAVFGKNRKNADEDGLIVPLCHEHHMELHSEGNQKMAKFFRAAAEIFWIELRMEEDHMSKEQAVEAWIRRYGKNYL